MMYMRLQFVLMQPTSPATDRPSQTRSIIANVDGSGLGVAEL
jgi:hypothetical protein